MLNRKKMMEPIEKVRFRIHYRNLRKCMKDPAAVAWRLNPNNKFNPSEEIKLYVGAACDAMYSRSMPMPKNRLGK